MTLAGSRGEHNRNRNLLIKARSQTFRTIIDNAFVEPLKSGQPLYKGQKGRLQLILICSEVPCFVPAHYTWGKHFLL